jgi:hypothetical protein
MFYTILVHKIGPSPMLALDKSQPSWPSLSNKGVSTLIVPSGKHTKKVIENGPVEIVDLRYKMVDLSIVMWLRLPEGKPM